MRGSIGRLMIRASRLIYVLAMKLSGWPYRSMRREMDEGCSDLVDALNELDGIQTQGSCSGHGIGQFFVTFHALKPRNMRPIVDALIRDWNVDEVDRSERWSIVVHSVVGDVLHCALIGPSEDREGAAHIVQLLRARSR